MKPLIPSLAAPKKNLVRLLIIRWVLVACLLVGTVSAQWWFQLDLPYATLSLIVLLILVCNLATWWRLRQPWAVTPLEFSGQMVLDILGITWLFYVTGGAGNPFVFYYLVPLSIASATLPWRYTASLTTLAVLCYTLLLFYHLPIPALSPTAEGHVHGASPINIHVLGMWFNFLISAGLITFFVVRMSSALREQQQQLTEHREESLRDEQVLAVATLAAGTAHEMGSPLTTMKLLLDEMQHDYPENAGLTADLQILKQQVELCSNTLKGLVRQADTNPHSESLGTPIGDYCDNLIDRWLLLRPDVRYTLSVQQKCRHRTVNFHSTVDQAIINLLNNAADACYEQVGVTIAWSDSELIITIIDDGDGIPEQVKEQLGQPFVTTKGKGLGLGLFLSNATLTRYGGSISLINCRPRGTELVIRMPLQSYPVDSATAAVR